MPHYAKDRFVRTNGPGPAQVQAAAASPQAQAAAQAEDPSPTSVAADLGEEGEMGILTARLEDLSLKAAAEMDVNWENITAELATE